MDKHFDFQVHLDEYLQSVKNERVVKIHHFIPDTVSGIRKDHYQSVVFMAKDNNISLKVDKIEDTTELEFTVGFVQYTIVGIVKRISLNCDNTFAIIVELFNTVIVTIEFTQE